MNGITDDLLQSASSKSVVESRPTERTVTKSIAAISDFSFQIRQNYPNPFNPSVQFYIRLPIKSDVDIRIYNVMGQRVRHLTFSSMSAGEYKIRWDGKNDWGQIVSSGVYFVHFKVNAKDKQPVEFQRMGRLVYVK